MIFYFSGTGNSRWVAQQLGASTQEEVCAIAEDMRKENCAYALRENERIGFVFPIYSWGPPQIVLDFVKRLNLENYQKNFLYFVCTCGDDVGKTRQIFEEAITEKKWKLNSAFSLQMPNTYVCLPSFNVDSDTLRTRKLEAAESSLSTILASILVKKSGVFELVEGSFAWIKSRLIRPGFNKMLNTEMDTHFTATDKCVGCGKCVSACPMENIEMHNDKPHWKGNCTSCLACYHTCPTHAIEYGKQTRNKGQYLHKNYVK